MKVSVFYSVSEGHVFSDFHFENKNRIFESINYLKTIFPNSLFPESTYSNSGGGNNGDDGGDEEKFIPLYSYLNLEYFNPGNKARICINCKYSHKSNLCPKCSSDFYCWSISNDTYVSSKSLSDVKYCISLIVQQIDLFKQGIKYGYLLIRPPGHHCYKKPHGFGLVNNVVIAASYAKNIGYERIFILDWDYHYPDGTFKFVKKRNDIFLFSIHAYGPGIFPGKKYGNKRDNDFYGNIFNVPINPGKIQKADDYYLQIVDSYVLPKIIEFNPDLIIISNGLDAHKDDPLAGLGLTNRFYIEATKKLKSTNLPLLYILEGGYNSNVIMNVSCDIIQELI